MEYWSLLYLPCLFWAAYHYYKDRHKPEPVLMLVLALVLGYCSAYIGLYLYEALDYIHLRFDAYELAESSSLQLFLYSVLAIGPIEELAKFIPFLFIIVRLPHFDEPIDGIIYSSFIALGFSLHENSYYLTYLEGWEALARSLTAPMVHVMFASIWGYAYGYSDSHGGNRYLVTFCFLLIAMFLHGVFDFFSIGLSLWANIAPPLLILTIWMWRLRILHRVQNEA
ncbi:PrsW family intramembrane metalloprotease [Hahella sp. KA22]|uniref:PrsW family intramembrane metalloprotease n=1 Tax=Hahella sp. KA22 TaxID=1628392 RepID=UPI000FDDDE03|nr:PrsW family intramembrane metalloprotease [Hahella sp. KA22]AZZ90385.1 PrsW family intramembrane metalloprotease [Hahella sp. KA22]QAY53755.1 PrsW family intramembrane metalloprotease [Hahella sp. KA22]